jgi:hypothetical protein
MLSAIDMWALSYPGMDRSAAIRCLLGCGLDRQQRRPAPQIRDPGTADYKAEDKYKRSWLWYRRGSEPERRSPWKDNAGDWGASRRAQANKAFERVRQQRLSGVAAGVKLLVSRGQEPTAEAIVAWFQGDRAGPRNGYTLADVLGYLHQLDALGYSADAQLHRSD